MSHPPASTTAENNALPSGQESPFLCSFCDDIKISGTGDEFDMQAELDVCQRCVKIDRSLRFADFLLIQ